MRGPGPLGPGPRPRGGHRRGPVLAADAVTAFRTDWYGAADQTSPMGVGVKPGNSAAGSAAPKRPGPDSSARTER